MLDKLATANKIKETRLMRQMTVEQMAIKLCCARPSIYCWESGRSLPGLDMMADIADVLNVSVDELLVRYK